MASREGNMIRILVDEDETYEKPGMVRKTINRLLWFHFINTLPKGLGTTLFTRSCEHTNLIRNYSKTYKALELMYAYKGFALNGNGILDSIFTHFWESSVINAHALRNRLKLVKKELKKIIIEKKNDQNIRILSLASGSARGVIEVLAELRDLNIEARFVDISRDALGYSRTLAEEYRVADKINWITADVRNVEKFCDNWQPDIVEAVGLFDYLNDDDAVRLIGKVYKALDQNGTLIISNVIENPEKMFVKDVVDWDMIYRDPDQLGELLIKGGFNIRSCRIILEPIGIHAVAVARRD